MENREVETKMKIQDYPDFIAKDKQKYYFVRLIPPSGLGVWKDDHYDGAMHKEIWKIIHASQVSIDVLKDLDVWDSLDEKVKEEVNHLTEHAEKEKKERWGKRGRKKLYPDFPSEIPCTKCGWKKKVASSMLGKLLSDKGVSLEDYMAGYTCKKCKSPSLNIPTELTCIQCKAVIKSSLSVMAKRIERLGITAKEFTKQFRCQKCHPTKGRKSNPKYAHLPKEIACCKCGVIMKCAPSQIVQRAKSKKMTPEKFMKQYACQKCVCTKGRGRKKKDNA